MGLSPFFHQALDRVCARSSSTARLPDAPPPPVTPHPTWSEVLDDEGCSTQGRRASPPVPALPRSRPLPPRTAALSSTKEHHRHLADERLVGAIAQHDQAALAEAYSQHGSRVHAIGRSLCGDARAKDLTQEIFL